MVHVGKHSIHGAYGHLCELEKSHKKDHLTVARGHKSLFGDCFRGKGEM